MAMEQAIEIAFRLENFLRDKKKSFISLTSLPKDKELLEDLRKHIKINKSEKAESIGEKILPYLGNKLVLMQKSSSWFMVVPSIPKETLLLEAIQAAPGKGPKGILQTVPFKKAEFLSLLNVLLENGSVRIKLNEEYEVRLYPSSVLLAPVLPGLDTDRQDREFEVAFRDLNREKLFVRIVNLRRKLNWTKEAFDSTLRRLRGTRKIQLHSGDVASMTSEDIADSFTDENRFLMLTLTWS